MLLFHCGDEIQGFLGDNLVAFEPMVDPSPGRTLIEQPCISFPDSGVLKHLVSIWMFRSTEYVQNIGNNPFVETAQTKAILVVSKRVLNFTGHAFNAQHCIVHNGGQQRVNKP